MLVPMTDQKVFVTDVLGEEAPAPIVRSLPKPKEEVLLETTLLPYGTTVDPGWQPDWISLVTSVERQHGVAICGAKRTGVDIDSMIRSGKTTPGEADADPEVWVCSHKAGLNTQHPGEGRCYMHGGNSAPEAKFALIKNTDMSRRVREYFANDDLTDLRGAIAMVWVAANAIVDGNPDEDGQLSMERSKELGSLMTRIGNLTKQHNEMIEKRKISIEVPEFIAWAEHFYELAVKYILDGKCDVEGFLKEAQSYYNATVTLAVGIDAARNGHPTSDPLSGDQAPTIL